MKSIIDRNKHLFLSFCMYIVLPVATSCLCGYLLSLLNGQTVESPALQSGITTLIGIGGLALLYWLIMGVRNFYKHLRIANEERKASLTIAAAPPVVKQRRERKQLSLPVTKWLKTAARTMLILALVALVAMALTNPSYEEFKAFTPERNTSLHYAEWRKVHNYLLWSVYQKDIFRRRDTDEKFKPVSSQQYRGMLLNFTLL